MFIQCCTLLFAVLCAMPSLALADELTVQKHADIQKLLDMTGTLKIGLTMSQTTVTQMTKVIKSTYPNIPDKEFEVLQEEVNAVISEHLPVVTEMMIQLYDKYYTDDDVKAMIAFYSTPLGQKVIKTMPMLSQEGMQVGITWGQSLGPEIESRVKARFKKKGYEL